MSADERLFRALLRLYPDRFRLAWADDMTQLFRDQLRDARRGRSGRGVARTWLSTFADVTSSAIEERLAGKRAVGHSLEPFEPSRSMRLLGAFGALGAILLLWAFITFNPFASPPANTIRLVAFSLGGPAIALALYRRQSRAAPALILAATAFVVIAGLWYAAWVILAESVPNPFSPAKPFGVLSILAGIALWTSAAAYGAAVLRTGVLWRSMSRWAAVAARAGAIILLGSAVAWIGDDRFGLVNSATFGWAARTVALAGVAANGLGWLLLGGVLVLGGRRVRPA
jgi:hypothetical protein